MASLPPSGHKPRKGDHQAIRTCVGCRERVDKADLVRLVVVDGNLTIDRDSTLPGRGAYLHPRSDCVESALRRRVLPRVLRWQGPLDTELVSDQLTSGIPSSR